MTATLNTLDLHDAAKEAAGNWREFGSNFCWHRKSELKSPEDWAIFYTHNRDSGLLDQSNAEAIAEAMEKYTQGDDPDVVFESHYSWLVGHVDGFSIRVYRRGKITRAFRTYLELSSRLANCLVLDEDDYFSRYYEATIENIGLAACKVKRDYNLPTGWEVRVYHWLSEHDLPEIEDHDDRGGWPSDEALRKAFDALGYKRIEE